MWALRLLDEKPDNNWQEQAQADKQRNRGVQVVLSLALGLSAFLAFCVRPPLLRISAGLTQIYRPCDQDGETCMGHGRGKEMQHHVCRSFQIASSAGFQSYTISLTGRFLLQQDLTLMLLDSSSISRG